MLSWLWAALATAAAAETLPGNRTWSGFLNDDQRLTTSCPHLPEIKITAADFPFDNYRVIYERSKGRLVAHVVPLECKEKRIARINKIEHRRSRNDQKNMLQNHRRKKRSPISRGIKDQLWRIDEDRITKRMMMKFKCRANTGVWSRAVAGPRYRCHLNSQRADNEDPEADLVLFSQHGCQEHQWWDEPNQKCRDFVCTCPKGKVSKTIKCTYDGQIACNSCRKRYVLQGQDCVKPEDIDVIDETVPTMVSSLAPTEETVPDTIRPEDFGELPGFFLLTVDPEKFSKVHPPALYPKMSSMQADNGECLGRIRANQVGLVHCDYSFEKFYFQGGRIFMQISRRLEMCISYSRQNSTLSIIDCKDEAADLFTITEEGELFYDAEQVYLTLFDHTQELTSPSFVATAFEFKNTISSKDDTSFLGCQKANPPTAIKTFYDHRELYKGWNVDIECYIVECSFSDNLSYQVLAAKGRDYDHDQLLGLAYRYSHYLGKMPTWLRRPLKELVINSGYGNGAGSSGRMSVNEFYIEDLMTQGNLEEFFLHELAHVSDDLQLSLLPSQRWTTAQERDPTCVTTYACEQMSREDVAESLVAWFNVYYGRSSDRQTSLIERSIRNRLALLSWYLSDLEGEKFELAQF